MLLQRAEDEKNALKAKEQWYNRRLKSGCLEKAVKVHATLAVELANQGAAEETPPLDIEFLRRIQDACGLHGIGCFHLGFLGQIDV